VIPVNDAEVLTDLRAWCARRRTQLLAARELGVSYETLRSALTGYRAVPHAAAERLGWELRWVRKEERGADHDNEVIR
jgi:hypothetical protein